MDEIENRMVVDSEWEDLEKEEEEEDGEIADIEYGFWLDRQRGIL